MSIIMRTFDVYLDSGSVERVYFVGEEYNAEAVARFLVANCSADRHIKVKLVKEVVTE